MSARGLVPIAGAEEFRAHLYKVRDAALQPADADKGTRGAPFFRSVRVSGGQETLGHRIVGTYICPSVVVSIGDLVVETVPASPKHELAPPHLLSLFLGLQPRKARFAESLTDEARTSLMGDAVFHAMTLRDFAYEGEGMILADPRNSETLEVYVRELLRVFIQDFGIGSVAAIRAFELGWKRDRGGAYRNLPTPLPRLELGAIAGDLELESETLFDGAKARACLAKLAAQVRVQELVATANHVEAERVAVLREVTPRSAGLVVIRRPAGERAQAQDAARVSFIHGPRTSTFRDGFEWRAFSRAILPDDASVLAAATVEEPNHVVPSRSIAWLLVGDDEAITLSVGDIERGQRQPPPALVLSAILAAAKAAVTDRTLRAFVDLRQRTECSKRIRLFREHAKRLQPLFALAANDPRDAAMYRSALLHFGIARLSLAPMIVATEAREHARAIANLELPTLVAECNRIAGHPAEYLFDRLDLSK